MSFPLTKTLALSDYDALAPELAVVNAFEATRNQATDHRRWEYSMALRAITDWLDGRGCPPVDPRDPLTDDPILLLDVGGAGSCFSQIAATLPCITARLIDPGLNIPIEDYQGDKADIVTALSVLEHTPNPRTFLRACARALRPGGLLVLSMDYWDCDGQDTAHFHWMRKRIFNRGTLGELIDFARERLGLVRFGETDWTYHGNQVYGEYTFATTAFVHPAIDLSNIKEPPHAPDPAA